MAKWCGQLITNNRLVSIPIVPADVDPLSKIIVSADKKLKYSNVAMKMEWKPTAKTAEFVTEMGRYLNPASGKHIVQNIYVDKRVWLIFSCDSKF